MEFDEIVVKESPGLCRCCLSEGCYKDLGSEYAWMNDREVYADMLLECFDISVSQQNEGPNGPNRLICEVCITRLRDACNFKKQVLDSEKKFIDMIGRGEFRPKVLIYQSDLKAEQIAEEPIPDAEEIEYLDEDIDFGDNAETFESDSNRVTVEDITVSALPVKGKRGRPRKNPETKPEKKPKVAKTEKARTSKVGKDSSMSTSSCEPDAVEPQKICTVPDIVNISKHELKKEDRKRKEDIIKLLNYILNNTTARPFRWFGGNYMCFFCGENFPHSVTLKEHMNQEHTEDGWKRLIKTLIGSKISGIKLDISEFTCKLCSNQFQTLKDYLDHASSLHKLKYNEELKGQILAFKLSDDEMFCLECHKKFTFFGPLLRHVHQAHMFRTHPFLCEMCGMGFVSKGNVDSHIKAVHSKGNITKKSVKNNVSYKCNKCSETFGSRYLRKRHLAFVHDLKSAQFICSDCDRVFTMKNLLQRHRSRVHMKEKNISCEICGFKVFNNDHLKRHMVCHDDSRPFECEICPKSFQRKKTLEYHRRIHLKDKRYVCGECGSAFVQHTSWKFHCKLHHAIDNPSWSKLKGMKK